MEPGRESRLSNGLGFCSAFKGRGITGSHLVLALHKLQERETAELRPESRADKPGAGTQGWEGPLASSPGRNAEPAFVDQNHFRSGE